jgi:hypothetical protein
VRIGRSRASISNERHFDAATSADAPIVSRREASVDWKRDVPTQPLPTQGCAMLPDRKSSRSSYQSRLQMRSVALALPREFARNTREQPARETSVVDSTPFAFRHGSYIFIGTDSHDRSILAAIGVRIIPKHPSNGLDPRRLRQSRRRSTLSPTQPFRFGNQRYSSYEYEIATFFDSLWQRSALSLQTGFGKRMSDTQVVGISD